MRGLHLPPLRRRSRRLAPRPCRARAHEVYRAWVPRSLAPTALGWRATQPPSAGVRAEPPTIRRGDLLTDLAAMALLAPKRMELAVRIRPCRRRRLATA